MGMALRSRSGRVKTTPRRASIWQKSWEKANQRFGSRYAKMGVNMPALGKALGFGAIPTVPKPAPATTQAAASVAPATAPAPAAASPAIPDPLPIPKPPDPYKPSKTGEYQTAQLSPTTGMRIGIEQ